LKERQNLPPDIANGLLFTLVKHIQPKCHKLPCPWWRPLPSHGW